MGQPITVVEKPSSSNPAILRLETNRPLSGMGHERYLEAPGHLLQRPVDELARRLFAAGGVERVHINGSVVTITLGGGRRGDGLADVVRELFLHYTDTPTEAHAEPLDEADASPESLADPADAPAAEAAADEAPAPDRPTEDEAAAADQEVPGIPDVEPAAAPDREPSPADPEDIAAAADGASPAPSEPADTPPVEPTAGDERPVAEPLEADPADVEADDASAG